MSPLLKAANNMKSKTPARDYVIAAVIGSLLALAMFIGLLP